MPLSVAVAGASGYAGGEVLRLLAQHPELQVTAVTAHSNAGQLLGDVQPHLRSLAGMRLLDTTPEHLADADVVVLALPHGQSGAVTAQLPDDVVVVDCGADHRLADPAAWERFYGGDFFGSWDYGIPELLIDGGTRKQRETLAGSTRIAAPGCNASAVSLALAPAIAAGVAAAQDLVAVLAVGTSGAGRSLKPHLLASEIAGSASAYQVGGVHRHIPEIQQNLVAAGGVDPTISFTPVLVPMSRGILATATAPLAPGVAARDVRDAYESAYAGEPFVQLLPEGAFPRSGDATGANTALLGVTVDEAAHRLVAICAIDNLVKGTAGAAIQSLNVALGFDETTALPVDGVAP